MDLFEKLLVDRGPLGQHSQIAHGYYAFPKLEGELAPRMKFRGKEVLTWSLNNYLGLGNHPEVRKTDTEATAEYGLAYPMGSRMMSGNSNLIEEFENQLSSLCLGIPKEKKSDIQEKKGTLFNQRLIRSCYGLPVMQYLRNPLRNYSPILTRSLAFPSCRIQPIRTFSPVRSISPVIVRSYSPVRVNRPVIRSSPRTIVYPRNYGFSLRTVSPVRRIDYQQNVIGYKELNKASIVDSVNISNGKKSLRESRLKGV